jgi:CRISPR-associated protein Cmr1
VNQAKAKTITRTIKKGEHMAIHVDRFLDKNMAHFDVEVLTPMFLGGADGHAELRSPPLKNALRYWWRLTRGHLTPDRLLENEQALFGGVHENKARDMTAGRSLVDIAVFGDVRTESKNTSPSIGKEVNPEAGGKKVSMAAYLGMGPVHFKGTYEKQPISAGESFQMTITWPRKNQEEILDALSFFAHFGCLGSRSRNGWGSIRLVPANKKGTGIKLTSLPELYEKYGKNIDIIFASEKQYPFYLGWRKRQGKDFPLLWQIAVTDRWENAMHEAAKSYMDIRQTLPFPQGRPGGVQKRHILGYPVTGHPVAQWDRNNGRMPSQLRIIIRKTGDKFQSWFLHLPHRIAQQWDMNLGNEMVIWQGIHQQLDNKCQPINFKSVE